MFTDAFSLGNTLTAGLTFLSFVVIITVYVVTGRTYSKILDSRLQMIDEEIREFKEEIRKLTEVVIQLSRVEDRQIAQIERLDYLQESFAEWSGLNGIYEKRHRELEGRVMRLEAACRRLPTPPE